MKEIRNAKNNYIIAFDRRQESYQAYETTGQIKTLEQIAPEDHLNPVSSMEEVAKNIIGKYNAGEIDAIIMKVPECGWILPLKLNLKNKNYSILDPTMAGTIQ